MSRVLGEFKMKYNKQFIKPSDS